jgi:hypothetical protein
MPLIRPRLTDYYDLPITQSECDFAIPLLDEDIPLYVDPFLLWKSPSLQDNALHTAMLASFNHIIRIYASGSREDAVTILVSLSECDEAGLGLSGDRAGKRIGRDLAHDALATLAAIPEVMGNGIRHIEILQLLVNGIGKDRISDIACSLIKSFLIDYTIEQSRRYRIPLSSVAIPEVYDYQSTKIRTETVELPTSPTTGRGILLIPKRWLRYSPWIGYDSYFEGGFIQGDSIPTERVAVLLYNRDNYGLVQQFVAQREAMSQECTSDPLFKPISVLSAKRRMASLRKLPSGSKTAQQYEDLVGSLLASVLHPQLDFASEQTRTESGAQIRDLIFYNSRSWDFLQDIHELYDSRQLVFELKNVHEIDREHINQLNRYLADQFGRFGVLVTRSSPPRRIEKNLVDLWSGQRRCIIVLTDEDLDLMVTLFESRQRVPIEVLKRSYVQFTRLLPS